MIAVEIFFRGLAFQNIQLNQAHYQQWEIINGGVKTY